MTLYILPATTVLLTLLSSIITTRLERFSSYASVLVLHHIINLAHLGTANAKRNKLKNNNGANP
jgi:hypothetical protein